MVKACNSISDGRNVFTRKPRPVPAIFAFSDSLAVAKSEHWLISPNPPHINHGRSNGVHITLEIRGNALFIPTFFKANVALKARLLHANLRLEDPAESKHFCAVLLLNFFGTTEFCQSSGKVNGRVDRYRINSRTKGKRPKELDFLAQD